MHTGDSDIAQLQSACADAVCAARTSPKVRIALIYAFRSFHMAYRWHGPHAFVGVCLASMHS